MNYKALALTLVISANANADVFTDIGDWVSDNKGTTAMIGIGALATASVVFGPLRSLQELAGVEEEGILSTEVLAGAEAQGNSLEALASKLNVEEDTVLDGVVGGAPDPEYSITFTPTTGDIVGTLRKDGYSEKQIVEILKRDTNLVTMPRVTDYDSLVKGIENPNKRIIDPSGLMNDTVVAMPKKGILKGAKDALKGVKNRIFKGANDERL